jgi:23S rRNA (cytidine1920-2'-O)/16S rRNA (cytidine1409-2'-O)-methyltransferase
VSVRRVRLDQLLLERGVFASRSRAAASVLAGEVTVGAPGRRVEKPGQLVAEDVEVLLAVAPAYVSRGGIKLANALDRLNIDVAGTRALDVGASTGGFTDCLLQRGAIQVAAVDVGYGELDWKLRTDPRVTVIERTNARSLAPAQLPFPASTIVIDVSFISLTKVLGAVLGCAAVRYDCLAMIKPQFEVGRGRVGKGGVVREPQLRRETLITVAEAAAALGASVCGFASSGLAGPKGNRETFVWLAEASRGGIPDVAAAAYEVEP